MVMRTIGAAEFKAHCLRILDEVDAEGIVITKRGKPVAKLVPAEPQRGMGEFIGILRGKVFINEDDDLSTADAWESWTPYDQEDE